VGVASGGGMFSDFNSVKILYFVGKVAMSAYFYRIIVLWRSKISLKPGFLTHKTLPIMENLYNQPTNQPTNQ
jgi:hypothetical protein